MNKTRLCMKCGLPIEISGVGKGRQKYHPECAVLVHRERDLHRKHENWEVTKAKILNRRATLPVCSCCHTNPVGPGNRFLCTLCFIYDGTEWMTIQHREWEERKSVEAFVVQRRERANV
jgi:hypothetical protein